MSARDVGRRADDAGVDDPLADPRRVVVDEADDAVGEVVLVEDLARDLARGLAGADDQDPLLACRSEPVSRLKSSRQPRMPTRKTNSAETKIPSPIISAGIDEVERRQHDRRGADRLEQPDDELAVGVHEREVVEVVVVEAELADDGHERDLPEARRPDRACPGASPRAPPIRRSGSSSAAEDREAARRDVPVEQLHGRESRYRPVLIRRCSRSPRSPYSSVPGAPDSFSTSPSTFDEVEARRARARSPASA